MIKYGFDTKPSNAAFDKLTDGGKHRFAWLGDKYPSTQDMVYACIGCAFDSVDVQFGTKQSVIDSYFKFKSRRDSMTRSLSKEILLCSDDNYDDIVIKSISGVVSPELPLLFESDSKLDSMVNEPKFLWARDYTIKLVKYKPFFNTLKYKHLINELAN